MGVASKSHKEGGMKAYGKKRSEATNRRRPGTSRPCPCCEINSAHRKMCGKSYKKRARREIASDAAQEY